MLSSRLGIEVIGWSRAIMPKCEPTDDHTLLMIHGLTHPVPPPDVGATSSDKVVSKRRDQEDITETNHDASALCKKRPRKQFVVPAPMLPRCSPNIPRASEVEVADQTLLLRLVPPSNMLLERLGSPKMLVGFDIETHGWLEDERNKGRIGKFGWYTLKEERVFEFARIVQLGWVIGGPDVDSEVRKKVSLIHPHGFEIQEKAARFHGISQSHALRHGRPLTDVLRDFMRDVLECCDHGGRVVAHQLEFDAGIILNELERCGLIELHDAWLRIAHKGFCTMDYEAGRWVYACQGKEVGPDSSKQCIGLDSIVRLLKDPLCDNHIQMLDHHHHADVDAQLTRLVYSGLLTRAKTLKCQTAGLIPLA